MGAAATCHLALIALSVSHVDPPDFVKPVLFRLARYAAFSGANNRYGFFAPAVSSPRRIICFGYVPAADDWVRVEMPKVGAEAAMRFAVIPSTLKCESGGITSDELAMSEAITASWSAWVFGQCPQFESVMVLDQALMFPELHRYAASSSRTPAWQTLKIYSFARRPAEELASPTPTVTQLTPPPQS